jgi:hypothetical protein
MGDKAKFIRDFVIRKAPEPGQIELAVVHAELLWKELTERGYGDKQSKAIVATDSFLSQMTEEQRVWFVRFWDAFNYKKSREPAAKEWLKLPVNPTLYQKIVDAAKREASVKLPAGQSRKFAQGWLSDKRYEDEHYATHQSPAPKLSAVEQVRAATGLDVTTPF